MPPSAISSASPGLTGLMSVAENPAPDQPSPRMMSEEPAEVQRQAAL